MNSEGVTVLDFQKLAKSVDIIAALVIAGIIFIFIIPLPTAILDSLLVFNIVFSIIFSIVILIISLCIANPRDFALLPAIMLVPALFRLALDASLMRMILLYGNIKNVMGDPVGAGQLVAALGRVAVGGNLIICILMIVILVVMQVAVVRKSAGLAQLFAVDDMAGEPPAVVADLPSGSETAEHKRHGVERGTAFNRAMDVAGKFVKCGAVASVLIMIVNIAVGILIGITKHKMDAGDAFNTYAALTIGSGLITAVPAFFISMPVGRILSRAASAAVPGEDSMK